MKTKKTASKITVRIADASGLLNFNRQRLKKMISAVAKKFNVKKGRINLLAADNCQIKTVNKNFLKKNKSTDVISFDLSPQNSGEKIFDIIVNAQLAQKEAKKRKTSAESELALYCLHGLLHNLGFNDLNKKEASEMHKKEDQILEKFGYGKTFIL